MLMDCQKSFSKFGKWSSSKFSKKSFVFIFSGNYGRCLLNKPGKNELDWFKSASQYPGQHFDENRLPDHQQFYERLTVS
jgi:hypothetical protein